MPLGVKVVLIRMVKVIRSWCLSPIWLTPPRSTYAPKATTQALANQRRAPSRSGGVEIIVLVP